MKASNKHFTCEKHYKFTITFEPTSLFTLRSTIRSERLNYYALSWCNITREFIQHLHTAHKPNTNLIRVAAYSH